MEQSLIIKNLSFKFSQEKPFFFKNVSLNFSSGSIHYIVGENGCGKSTLLRLFLERISSEEYFSGEIQKCGPMQLVVQNYHQMLAPSFSFKENISFASLPKHPTLSLLSKALKIPALFKKFNIPLDQPISSFSGGQKQIVSIMMALQKPLDILLLDEPTASLDKDNALMVLDFLREMVKETNITVIMVCHQQSHLIRCGNSSCIEVGLDEKNNIRTVHQRQLYNI